MCVMVNNIPFYANICVIKYESNWSEKNCPWHFKDLALTDIFIPCFVTKTDQLSKLVIQLVLFFTFSFILETMFLNYVK